MLKNSSVEQDIAFIRNVIEKSRNDVAENGINYIIWGVLVSLTLIATYFFIEYEVYNYIYYAWGSVIVLGWGLSAFLYTKSKDEERTVSHLTKIYGYVWLSICVGISVSIFLGIYPRYFPVLTTISIIMGVGFFISSYIVDTKILFFCAIMWWLSSFMFFFWQTNESLLIFAIMMLLFQVLPGIILKNRWKK